MQATGLPNDMSEEKRGIVVHQRISREATTEELEDKLRQLDEESLVSGAAQALAKKGAVLALMGRSEEAQSAFLQSVKDKKDELVMRAMMGVAQVRSEVEKVLEEREATVQQLKVWLKMAAEAVWRKEWDTGIRLCERLRVDSDTRDFHESQISSDEVLTLQALAHSKKGEYAKAVEVISHMQTRSGVADGILAEAEHCGVVLKNASPEIWG